MSFVQKSLMSAVVLALAVVACEKKSDPPKVTSTTSTAASVVPGSHEDWCEEHAVPESQCTRCNAKLIPAFKATGDWCEQHQLPKSQDTQCNPNLQITRPPKKG